MKHVKANPHLIFGERVEFRSATGQFAKPFRAFYAFIYLPRKRKPIILDLYGLGRRSNEATFKFVKDFLVEYYREVSKEEIRREERDREKIRARKPRVVPRGKQKYRVQKTLAVVQSSDDGQFRRIVGFNFIFDKAVTVDFFSVEKIMKFLNAEVKAKIKKVVKPYMNNGYKLLVKFYGSEYYIRRFRASDRNLVDVMGFALSRTDFSSIEEAGLYSDSLTDSFGSRLKGDTKNVGYLSRKMQLVTDKRGQPILNKAGKKQYERSEDQTFKIYGFRIEFSKAIT